MPKSTKKPTKGVPEQAPTEAADATEESDDTTQAEPAGTATDSGAKPVDRHDDSTEHGESDDEPDDDTTVQETPVGQRVTRRTIARRTTREDVEETITEDVALWSPPSVAGYPRPVG